MTRRQTDLPQTCSPDGMALVFLDNMAAFIIGKTHMHKKKKKKKKIHAS